jgi:hypothetical protein
VVAKPKIASCPQLTDRQISTAARKMSKFPIVTQIGSSGFENHKNVIVVEDVADTLQLLLGMVETKGRKL